MVAVGPIGIVGFYLRPQIFQQAILEGCVRQNWCADSCSRTAIVGHRGTQGPLDVKITKPLSERDGGIIRRVMRRGVVASIGHSQTHECA